MKKQEIDQKTSKLIITQAYITIPLFLVYIMGGVFHSSIIQWVGVSYGVIETVRGVSLFTGMIMHHIYGSKIRRSRTAFKSANLDQCKVGLSNQVNTRN